MTDLVACLSTGKGTWKPVIKLIKNGDFNNVFLITNEFGEENFNPPDYVELIVLEKELSEEEMRDVIKEKVAKGVESTEVALNMTSGSGKEHMAMISAILNLGLGIRFVVPSDDGFEEL